MSTELDGRSNLNRNLAIYTAGLEASVNGLNTFISDLLGAFCH